MSNVIYTLLICVNHHKHKTLNESHLLKNVYDCNFEDHNSYLILRTGVVTFPQ